MIKNLSTTVGLFGVCEKTTWRRQFIQTLVNADVNFFNPQLPEGAWSPEFAPIEAKHLGNDGIIAMMISDDSYGFGSLAEVGFALLNSAPGRADDDYQDLVVYIAPEVSVALQEADPAMAKASNRTRALVRAHLKRVEEADFDVYIVDSLEAAAEKCIELAQLRKQIIEATE